MGRSLFEISDALEQAIAEHGQQHGNDSRRTRDAIKILLWDNRREIYSALKIAASLEKHNGR